MPTLPLSLTKNKSPKKETEMNNSTKPVPAGAKTGPMSPKSREEKNGGKKKGILFPYLHLAIGLVLTGILGYGLFFASQKLAVFSLKVEQDKSRLAAMEEAQIGNLSLEKRYQSVEPEAEVIARAFPNEETIIDFFKLFRRLVGTLTVESFDFETDQPVSDQNGKPYIGFGVNITGNDQEVELLLNRMDQLPYLIEYRLVDLEYPRPGEAKLVIQARLGVDYNFYLLEEDEQ